MDIRVKYKHQPYSFYQIIRKIKQLAMMILANLRNDEYFEYRASFLWVRNIDIDHEVVSIYLFPILSYFV